MRRHLALPTVTRRSSHGLLPPGLTKDSARDVHQPDDAGDNAVSDRPIPWTVGKHEAETTVDDAKGDETTTHPNVGVGIESAVAVLLKELVVQVAEDGHEEHKGEDKQANDGMVTRELIEVSGEHPRGYRLKTYVSTTLAEVNTETNGRDEHGVGKDLETTVEPDETGEAECPDGDGTQREKDYHGETGQDSVSNQHLLHTLILGQSRTTANLLARAATRRLTGGTVVGTRILSLAIATAPGSAATTSTPRRPGLRR